MDLTFITRIIVDWGRRCFGIDHMRNPGIRSLRLAEEAVELAQACRVPKETMHKLIDTVYARPAGDPLQEVGGVLVTSVAMCSALGISAQYALETEIHRCLSKSPEHFARRNEEKLAVGLDA